MLKKESEQLWSKPNQYSDEETFGRDDARVRLDKLDLLFLISHFLDLGVGGRLLFIILFN